jgi:LDH2 family malate/lactate/ureidoglycolate dehydrogenase
MTTQAPIAAGRLQAFVTAAFVKAGVPGADAGLVADTLVQADLWGHQSHGVLRLGWYLARLRSGVMAAVTAPELVVDAGAVAVLDGRDGIGQVLTARAAREAVARAKAHGVGAVAVRNSGHFGTAMYFTRMAAREGCVAFLSTNSSPAMAPWGGRRKAVGSNPWSIAAPAGQHPAMMLDIANTGVARGKIYLARNKGLPIPLGWALDASGAPTTDPAAAIAGIILPMAGHKGYAISVMMDMLSGVLTGSAFGTRVNGPYVPDRVSGAGHFMFALDITRFMPLDEFGARMERLIADLKSVPPAQGFDEVFYPGELEARHETENRRAGLLLPEDTLADLERIGMGLGLELPF